MFDEIKYTYGYCNYLAIGIAEKWSDSRIIWWETERYLNKRSAPTACLEHCAVALTTGIYLDSMGVFFSADDREDEFEDLSTSAHGTLQDFKGYLRKIKCVYGDYREKATVEKVLKRYRPVVEMVVGSTIQRYCIENCTYNKNMIVLQPVRYVNPEFYVICGKVVSVNIVEFKQQFVCNIGWKHVHETTQ